MSLKHRIQFEEVWESLKRTVEEVLALKNVNRNDFNSGLM